MKRRDFLKSTLIGSAALSLPAVSMAEKAAFGVSETRFQTILTMRADTQMGYANITGIDQHGNQVTERVYY